MCLSFVLDAPAIFKLDDLAEIHLGGMIKYEDVCGKGTKKSFNEVDPMAALYAAEDADMHSGSGRCKAGTGRQSAGL